MGTRSVHLRVQSGAPLHTGREASSPRAWAVRVPLLKKLGEPALLSSLPLPLTWPWCDPVGVLYLHNVSDIEVRRPGSSRRRSVDLDAAGTQRACSSAWQSPRLVSPGKSDPPTAVMTGRLRGANGGRCGGCSLSRRTHMTGPPREGMTGVGHGAWTERHERKRFSENMYQSLAPK